VTRDGTRREEGGEVDSWRQHGIPRVSATVTDKSEQAKEKERKHIEQYKAHEQDVRDRVRQRHACR